MTINDGQSPSAPSPAKSALRPSDILKLNNNTRVHLDLTKVRDAESHLKQSAAVSETVSKHNDCIPLHYIIPQKRVWQLRSIDQALPPTQRSRRHWNYVSKPRSSKEKVVGRLSEEDQLQAMWAKFDEEEREQGYRSALSVREDMISGNDVLGAWEGEELLHDLEQEEAGW